MSNRLERLLFRSSGQSLAYICGVEDPHDLYSVSTIHLPEDVFMSIRRAIQATQQDYHEHWGIVATRQDK